jgi:hypothetical protein
VTRPADTRAVRLATARTPYVVFQHVARDRHYAEIAVAPVRAPRSSPTFTGLVCERVYYAGGKGLCLLPAKDALSASVEAHVFGTDFKPVSKARVAGRACRPTVATERPRPS